MTKTALHKVDHSILRYANCWEDADLLLEALKPEPASRILSIGSAGDNSFSLLTTYPEKLVCVDINATQLALIKLKKAAFQTLDYPEFLEFLGFTAGEPLRNWKKVQQALDDEMHIFWQSRLELICKGLIYNGKFERYLLTFQRKLLPLIHSGRAVEELFQTKGEDRQRRFYQNKWDNRRWRLFTRLFFSRKILGWGRDPEFLKQVEGNVGKRINKKINHHLSSTEAQQNHFLHFMLRGHFSGSLPHYARAENFEKIKENLDRLEVFHGLLEDYAGGDFTHANLSNIFEYLDQEVFEAHAKTLARLMRPGAKLAYWNLLVERELAVTFPEDFCPVHFGPGRQDYGFFYQSFKLNRKS